MKTKELFLTISAVLLLLFISSPAVMALGPRIEDTTKAQVCEGTGGQLHDQGDDGQVCVQDQNNDGDFNDADLDASAGLPDIVETIVNTLIYIVGAASVIMLLIGGIRYVVSAGDQNAVQGAKNTILYAIVGIVVAFSAFAIVNFVITELIG